MARRRGVAFTLGALLFMVFALAAIAVLPVVTGYLSLSNATEWLVTLGKWAILLIGVALAVSLIYRYGPSREKPQWRWVTWGSAVVAAHFGSYNKKYGSLGAVIGFMTWIWLSTCCSAQNSMRGWSTRPCATRPPDQRSRRGAGRVCRRPSGPTFSVERSAAAIAFREAPTPARGPAQENGRAETFVKQGSCQHRGVNPNGCSRA
jgi:hypothetical protein